MTAYPEPLVARVTGVNRSDLADTRRKSLTKDVDWRLVNAVVTYTPDGLKKLLSAAGIDLAALVWPEPGATENAGARALDPAAAVPDPAQRSVSSSPVLEPAAVVSAACETANGGALVELTVTAVLRNPTILRAVVGEDPKPLTVRVRDNRNFLPGMKLKARSAGPGSDLYHMVGHCPRWRGRY